jgi:hypothetical protein
MGIARRDSAVSTALWAARWILALNHHIASPANFSEIGGATMPKDFGYFGKGLTGYTHYMQAFNRNNGGGKPPPGGKSGCLSCLLLPLIIALIFILI